MNRNNPDTILSKPWFSLLLFIIAYAISSLAFRIAFRHTPHVRVGHSSMLQRPTPEERKESVGFPDKHVDYITAKYSVEHSITPIPTEKPTPQYSQSISAKENAISILPVILQTPTSSLTIQPTSEFDSISYQTSLTNLIAKTDYIIPATSELSTYDTQTTPLASSIVEQVKIPKDLYVSPTLSTTVISKQFSISPPINSPEPPPVQSPKHILPKPSKSRAPIQPRPSAVPEKTKLPTPTKPAPSPPPKSQVTAQTTKSERYFAASLSSPLYAKPFPNIPADVERQEAIKEAFLHAWNSYEKYCWGSDELRPSTRKCHNYLNAGLTIIDSLSTLKIMGLDDEFAKARAFVANDFSPHGSWSIFEFMIRFVGGFISAYDLTGDKLFLERAIDAGDAVFELIGKNGFFGSDLTLSYKNGHLKASGGTGTRLLAEAGTYQLEFAKLSQLTGDPKYIDLALQVYRNIWKSNPRDVLVSSVHGSTNGLHVGAATDSYFEYIIKTYILTGGTSKIMLEQHVKLMDEIRDKLTFYSKPNNLTGVGINNNGQVHPMMEHLATFIAGTMALGTVKGNPHDMQDLKYAADLVETFHAAQQSVKSNLMAERMSYNTDPTRTNEFRLSADEYLLRPETIESIYHMWKFTGLPKYRDYAWDFFQGIEKSCRLESGYTRVTNLNGTTTNKGNLQDSFFLAETLKYLYLTFSDSRLMSPTEWVFNTEAHPLRMFDADAIEKWKDMLSLKETAETIHKARNQ